MIEWYFANVFSSPLTIYLFVRLILYPTNFHFIPYEIVAYLSCLESKLILWNKGRES